jgi:hypothetical protein
MGKKTAVVFGLVVMVFLGVAALAISEDGFITFNGGKQFVALRKLTGPVVPMPESDTALQTISGNLNTDNPHGLYFSYIGDSVGGPQSARNMWVAVPFTPVSNVSVKKVQAAIQYFNGTNEIVLSINDDSSGLPGSVIATFHVKHLPASPSCCKLAVGTSASGIPLTQGTQYWLVASTDSTDSDFAGGWMFNTTDMRSYPFAVYFPGKGWQADAGLPLPAYAVLGN